MHRLVKIKGSLLDSWTTEVLSGVSFTQNRAQTHTAGRYQHTTDRKRGKDVRLSVLPNRCLDWKKTLFYFCCILCFSLDDGTDAFPIWLCCLSLTCLQTHAVILSWSLTLLWISQHWNLTLHILQARKGGQFQWTSIDLILWASLVNDLCLTLFFFFFFLLPCQQCPKLKRPALGRSLRSRTCIMREGPQVQMLPPWGGGLQVERRERGGSLQVEGREQRGEPTGEGKGGGYRWRGGNRLFP